MKTVFLRALEADDKAAALRDAIGQRGATGTKQRFEIELQGFQGVPRSPFAYWMSDNLRSLFNRFPPLERAETVVAVGLQTSDDFRFCRCWFEIPARAASVKKWVPIAKGGSYSPFYADVDLVVLWELEGRELKAWAGSLYNDSHWSRIIKGTEYYGRPGLSFLRRTHRLCVRPLPVESIFSDGAQAVFGPERNLASMMALLNSRIFDHLVKLVVGRTGDAVQFMGGMVALTPTPPEQSSDLGELAVRAWSLKHGLETRVETSHCFILPAVLQVVGHGLHRRVAAWADRLRTIQDQVGVVQSEIDKRCFDLYGISEDDRRSITEGFDCGVISTGDSEEPEDPDAPSADSDIHSNADAGSLAAELISWAVGVAFGRFDIRLATGAKPVPTDLQPFDPLPVCSPAMLTDDGLPLTSVPAGYPLAFPENGILVDDLGHTRDLAGAVRTVFDEVFNETADEWWNEVAAVLDPKLHDLRTWLGSRFFERHLTSHFKGRRKAPIVWQLTVPSERYSVWLYAHLLTRDSFFQIQNDVVTSKVAHEERELMNLVKAAGPTPSAKERKDIVAQEIFVEELRAFLDEVKRVAPLWNPVLDDGIVLTMAPLWRLVPLHSPWRKELRAKWAELAAGKYDWAHLAMHLWPERVVPKCMTNRNLAIAHGLEKGLWVEDAADGKWKPRKVPTSTIEELVRERTSVAVKAALKSLLDAPIPGAIGARRHIRPEASI